MSSRHKSSRTSSQQSSSPEPDCSSRPLPRGMDLSPPTVAQYHIDRWFTGLRRHRSQLSSDHSDVHGRSTTLETPSVRATRYIPLKHDLHHNKNRQPHRERSPRATPEYRFGRPSVPARFGSRSSYRGAGDQLSIAIQSLNLDAVPSRGRPLERTTARTRAYRSPTPTGRQVYGSQLPGIVYGSGPVPGQAVSLSGPHSPNKATRPSSTFEGFVSASGLHSSSESRSNTELELQKSPPTFSTSRSRASTRYTPPSTASSLHVSHRNSHHPKLKGVSRHPSSRDYETLQCTALDSELRPGDSISQIGPNPPFQGDVRHGSRSLRHAMRGLPDVKAVLGAEKEQGRRGGRHG